MKKLLLGVLCGGVVACADPIVSPGFLLVVPLPVTNVNDKSAEDLATLINQNQIGYKYVTAADIGMLLFKENDPSDGIPDAGSSAYKVDITLNESGDSFVITWLDKGIADATYLVVKDGNLGGTYVYDISTWNGMDTITGTGFYVGNGSISHVSVWGTAVPDNGLTAAMLGLGVLGVGYMARRKS